MSHNLEFINGQASFVSRSVPGWHRLGTVVEKDMTVAEALAIANADFDVWLEPVYALVNYEGRAKALIDPDKKAVIRRNPANGEPQLLATNGNDYGLVSNPQAFSLADYVALESDDGKGTRARVETAASLDNGRRAFVTMKTPGDFVLDPNGANDRIESYLLFTNSFDGTLAINVISTEVRVVCQNTLTWAMEEGNRVIRLKHTRHVEGKLEQAKKILGEHFQYRQAFQATAEKLLGAVMTVDQFMAVVDKTFKVPTGAKLKELTDRQQRNIEEVRTGCQVLFTTSPTNENIRGTAWAGVNAIGEYLDWYRDVKVADPDKAADRRAFGQILDPKIDKKKQEALNLTLAFAGA